jgi:hypothetical protein
MPAPSERRKYRRFDVPCRLNVDLPGGGGVRVRTINVSDGGAYFVTDEEIEIGRQVNVRLTVPRDTANTFFLEQFAARASVIRCESEPQNGGRRVALQFEKVLVLDLA